MTQKEKEILIKDLSARLLYGVKVHIEHDVFYDEVEPYNSMLTPKILDDFLRMERLEVRPYLRPMSSMTEEERKEERKLWDIITRTRNDLHYLYTDFLLSHHLDYRGLIPMELALEAKEGMYD